MAARVRNNGSARRRGQGRRRVTSLAHAFVGATSNQTWTFGYNAASQRTGRTSANALFDWTNRPPATVNKTYDGLNRDAAIAATTGGYDANGNLTSDGTRAFTYDVENRLLSGSAPTPITISYDPLGRLAQTTATSATTNFLYDGDRLSAEYDGAGNLLRRYVHGPGVDEPLVWYEGSGATDRRQLHQDPQGSVVAWSDGAGNTSAAQIQAYGPYGEPQAWARSRFRYTGQIAIPEAKLYYYKARVYDPATGRFLQTDPIGQEPDPNLYAYVKDDPTNETDPTGNCPLCATAVIGAGGGALVGLGSQIFADVVTGHASGPEAYLGSIAGGAAGGAVLGAGGGFVAAGAVGGAVSGAISQGVGAALKPGATASSIAGATVKGAAVGGLVGAAGGAGGKFLAAGGKGVVANLAQKTAVGRAIANNEKMTNMMMGKVAAGAQTSEKTGYKMIAGQATAGAGAGAATATTCTASKQC